MQQRTAFSLLKVENVDDERRVITGVASTPTVDRMGDIVEPMGAQFKTPMPLLLYHNHTLPVGQVDFAKPNKKGIPFKASLPNVIEAGTVQDRVNEAWHSVKYGLLACVSIGFRAFEDGYERIQTGYKFNVWEWLELTLCAVPANPDAVINGFKAMDGHAIREALRARDENLSLIKSIDTQLLAASGHKRSGVSLIKSPPASRETTVRKRGPVQIIPRK